MRNTLSEVKVQAKAKAVTVPKLNHQLHISVTLPRQKEQIGLIRWA